MHYKERRKDMTQWAEWAKELKTQLYIKTEIIGFKRFENPDEIDQIPGLRRMTRFFVLCQMIFQARRWGFTVGAKNTDPMFSHCARIHGMKEIPPGMECPTRGLRWVSSWEDEKRRFKAMKRIPFGGAVVFAPLATMTFEPDVVMIYGDPSQIIMIIQSLQRKEFERFEFACIGESSCSDSLADCYLTGKPKLGLPGFGERRNGLVTDEELVIALPPQYLPKAVEGWRELRTKNVRYPIPFMGADMSIKEGFAKSYPDEPEFK
jgi:uncharacterized protein (DUF169 family)